jgi:hypothetical protein
MSLDGITAKDLVKKLLVVDPELRLSVGDSLSHPFLQVCAWGEGEGKIGVAL